MFSRRPAITAAPASKGDKAAAIQGGDPKRFSDAGDRAIGDLQDAIALHSKHMTSTAGVLTPAHQRTQAEVQRLMSSALDAFKGDEKAEDNEEAAEGDVESNKPAGKGGGMFPKR